MGVVKGLFDDFAEPAPVIAEKCQGWWGRGGDGLLDKGWRQTQETADQGPRVMKVSGVMPKAGNPLPRGQRVTLSAGRPAGAGDFKLEKHS